MRYLSKPKFWQLGLHYYTKVQNITMSSRSEHTNCKVDSVVIDILTSDAVTLEIYKPNIKA